MARARKGRSSHAQSKADREILPILEQRIEPAERIDAARNRARILSAARRLLAKRPIDSICMDAVALEAGVGKGTLYRRFPDRTALCLALLDVESRKVQARLLSGVDLPASMPPRDRVLAVLELLLEFVVDQTSLLSEAWSAHKGGPSRYLHPGHAWMTDVVTACLANAMRTGAVDAVHPRATAEMLLAVLHPDLVSFLLNELGGREPLVRELHRFWDRALGASRVRR